MKRFLFLISKIIIYIYDLQYTHKKSVFIKASLTLELAVRKSIILHESV